MSYTETPAEGYMGCGDKAWSLLEAHKSESSAKQTATMSFRAILFLLILTAGDTVLLT